MRSNIWVAPKLPLRQKNTGFSLLETLIAFAIFTVVLGTVYSSLNSMAVRNTKVDRKLALTELAHAVLTEYTVTYPEMPQRGKVGELYEWAVISRPYEVEGDSSIIAAEYLEIEVQAWVSSLPDRRQTLRTLLAVRTGT